MSEGDAEDQEGRGEPGADAFPDWIKQMMAQEATLMGGVAEALRAAAAQTETLETDPAKLADIQARNLAAFEQATTTSGRQAIDVFRAGLQRLQAELAEAPAGETEAPQANGETEPGAKPPQRYAANMAQELSAELAQLRRDALLASLRDASSRLSELAKDTRYQDPRRQEPPGKDPDPNGPHDDGDAA